LDGASAAARARVIYDGAAAAVDYVNKNLGGINGRPIRLIHCATIGTPDSVTNCANKAADAKPDLVIQGSNAANDTAVPIFESAGIPYVTLNAGSPEELTSPTSFVLAPGYAPQLATIPAYAAGQGYKSVGVIYANVQVLSTPMEAVAKVFKKEGVKYVPQSVSITMSDLTPAYSALKAKKVDAIAIVGSLAQCSAALKARQSLADSGPIFLASVCNTKSVLESVPSSVTDGLLVPDTLTAAIATDKDTEVYNAAMKRYQPQAPSTAGNAATGFASIMNVYRVLSKVSNPSTLDAKSITAALASATEVPQFLASGATFSCGKKKFPQWPSVCASAGFMIKYSNGSYKILKTYDTAKLLEGIGG
jgi:branched-chain amino acid transport system substrate-binding protein